jgi:hypothetical protein
MPNRCHNSVDISWPKEDLLKIKRLINVKKDIFFYNIKRTPKKLMEDRWRYEWNISNRGTKRDVCDISVNEANGNLYISYNTARCPGENAIELLSKKFPKTIINLEFSEEGMSFSWRATFEWWLNTEYESFNDAYYWETKPCKTCWVEYGEDEENDRGSKDDDICVFCAGED